MPKASVRTIEIASHARNSTHVSRTHIAAANRGRGEAVRGKRSREIGDGAGQGVSFGTLCSWKGTGFRLLGPVAVTRRRCLRDGRGGSCLGLIGVDEGCGCVSEGGGADRRWGGHGTGAIARYVELGERWGQGRFIADATDDGGRFGLGRGLSPRGCGRIGM
jgi:hypothetical protein